jgi:hypothetical protein
VDWPASYLGVDLTEYRLHNRYSLGVDFLSLLLAQLANHPAFGIEILGDQANDRW